tara:strand:+ start:36 stop:398 length:363 start_codon:yes stop_codon:yes gene_type:complete
MATLTPTLTLTSTNALSDSLDVTFTDSLTVTDPCEIGKVTVLHNADTTLVAQSGSDTHYIYVKNHDTDNYVEVQDGGGTNIFAKLHPGEFAFFCEHPGEGVILLANTASCIVEYGIFKKG